MFIMTKENIASANLNQKNEISTSLIIHNHMDINHQLKPNRSFSRLDIPESIVDEADMEEYEDANKVIEESLNGRWSKLDSEIISQKLIDFDSTHLGIDTEKGSEVAWNEMKFSKTRPSLNRFESVKTLQTISEKLDHILKFLIELDHSNILKFYDYWFVDNAYEAKLVVITEYSTAGSLKKVLDSSKMSRTKVKPQTYKRWLNQILYSFKYLHNRGISIFQGNLNADSIFIQNSGVIKLTPSLLCLNGICTFTNNTIKCSTMSTAKKSTLEYIKLNDEIKVKDMRAIGRLAVEIFTAHSKNRSPVSPMGKRASIFNQKSFELSNGCSSDDDDYLLSYLHDLEDKSQRDFVEKCFNISRDLNIDSIWFDPFINSVQSLKVLSVFSILTYFQDKKSNSSQASRITKRMSSREDLISSAQQPKIVVNNESHESDNELSYLANKKKKDTINKSHTNLNELAGELNTSQCNLIRKSSSNSSLSKSNLNLNQLKLQNSSDRRKVSLTFLTSYNNLKIPQHFFAILEDIRAGLYPRLFKDNDLKDMNLLAISSTSCLDFVIQQKQIIDRRSSVSSYLNIPRHLSRKSSQDLKFNEIADQNVSMSPKESTLRLLIENRRLASESCVIRRSEKHPNMIELCLNLRFNDNLSRSLQSYFPVDFLNYLRVDMDQRVDGASYDLLKSDLDLFNSFIYDENPFETKLENICTHLANELIDFGLINSKDHNLISDLFLKTIKEHISSLLPGENGARVGALNEA